ALEANQSARWVASTGNSDRNTLVSDLSACSGRSAVPADSEAAPTAGSLPAARWVPGEAMGAWATGAHATFDITSANARQNVLALELTNFFHQFDLHLARTNGQQHLLEDAASVGLHHQRPLPHARLDQHDAVSRRDLVGNLRTART